MTSLSPAGSPPSPAPAVLPNPRKRPSLAGPAGPGAKRRKPSVYSASGSAHPLRQTSFPPEDSALSAGGLRSPSVETDITQSVAASGTGKRGRKRKSGIAGDTASVRSGPSAKGTPSRGARGDTASRVDGAVEAGAGLDGDEAGDDDEEEDAIGDADVDVASRAYEEDKARYSALFEAADDEQKERLTNFRRFHLNEGKVRRIVNQTLSQSVPKSVITAVNSYTKYFVGTLIERAIEIQRHTDLGAIGALVPPIEEDEAPITDDMVEHVASQGEEPRGGTMSKRLDDKPQTNGNSNGSSQAPSPSTSVPVKSPEKSSVPSTPASARPRSIWEQEDETWKIQKRQHEAGKEISIGPLRPDSLRESLRRLKREGEFGGVGVEGFSVGLGVPGSRASMMGGRKLFR